MLNASLLRPQDLVSLTPVWFPLHGTLAGYRSVLSSQGGHLMVSLVVSLGTVVVTLAVAAPAAYGMAKLRVPGRRLLLFALLVAQMIPGIVMANSFYEQPRAAQLPPRADPGRLDAGRAFRHAHPARVPARRAQRAD
jgi:multiple sugar transport system permease protein